MVALQSEFGAQRRVGQVPHWHRVALLARPAREKDRTANARVDELSRCACGSIGDGQRQRPRRRGRLVGEDEGVAPLGGHSKVAEPP